MENSVYFSALLFSKMLYGRLKVALRWVMVSYGIYCHDIIPSNVNINDMLYFIQETIFFIASCKFKIH